MNAINVIRPYKHLGMWVFDDPRVCSVQKPLVAGTDMMIDRAVAGIGDAEQGFVMTFSEPSIAGARGLSSALEVRVG